MSDLRAFFGPNAGYVADLKTEYEADTRFQLGYTMGRMGVSGEDVEVDDS